MNIGPQDVDVSDDGEYGTYEGDDGSIYYDGPSDGTG